jgi:hypothetical protein
VRSNNEVVFAGAIELQAAALPLVDTGVCRAAYTKLGYKSNVAIGDAQLCAGMTNGLTRDSCGGDSGGPLVAFDRSDAKYQIGVVSWGADCAKAAQYGVYTRVSQIAEWLRATAGPVVAVAPSQLAPTTAQPTEADRAAVNVRQRFAAAALGQIAQELGPATGRVRITIPGGTRVAVGRHYNFEIESDLAGRLIVVDIDAAGQQTPLIPNDYMRTARTVDLGRVAQGQRLTVPPRDSSWGFPAFMSTGPIGKGHLLALVVPDHFPIEATVAAAESMEGTKGFKPAPPTSYLMNVVAQILQSVGLTRSAGGGSSLPGWGWAVLEYEIVQ